MHSNFFNSNTQTKTQTQPQIKSTSSFVSSSYLPKTYSLNTRSGPHSDNTNTELINAIALGKYDIVKKLVTSINVNKIIDFDSGSSALHFAVNKDEEQSHKIIEYLLDCGADPELTRSDGKKSIDLIKLTQTNKYLLDKFRTNTNKIINTQINTIDDVTANLNHAKRECSLLVISNKEKDKKNDELNDELACTKRKSNIFEDENTKLKCENKVLESTNIKLVDSNNKLLEDKAKLTQLNSKLLEDKSRLNYQLEQSQKATEILIKKQRKN